jgi:hypothetical protein
VTSAGNRSRGVSHDLRVSASDATELTGSVFRFAGSDYISETVSSSRGSFKKQLYERVCKEQSYEAVVK